MLGVKRTRFLIIMVARWVDDVDVLELVRVVIEASRS